MTSVCLLTLTAKCIACFWCLLLFSSCYLSLHGIIHLTDYWGFLELNLELVDI
jgi:hypothetical protein